MSSTHHLDDIARELKRMEDIALKSLTKLGANISEARDIIRLSRLLWNIIDSWYRDKVYRGEIRGFLKVDRDEEFRRS